MTTPSASEERKLPPIMEQIENLQRHIDALVIERDALALQVAATPSSTTSPEAEPVAWRWKREGEQGWNHVAKPLHESLLNTYKLTQEPLFARSSAITSPEPKKRELWQVLDQIIELAPDLKDALHGTRQSCLYQPPECQPELWNRAAMVLNTNAADHPKKAEIAAIFSGTPDRRSA